MMRKIKKNLFCFFFGLVATGIFYTGDCLSDAVADASGTPQCYNIGGHEVCYFIGSSELLDWRSAYEICERKNSTLPIIRNEDEQNIFVEYLKYLQLKRYTIRFVWTAGERKNFNDWTWINGQPVSDKVRQGMLPGNIVDTHAVIMKDHSIGVRDPELQSPFLCQFYGDRCLLSGKIKMTNGCVVISSFMVTWFNARSHCLVRGGDLAVLSDQDLQSLKNHSQQLPVTNIWIGLRKMGWFWQLDSEGKQTEEIKYKKWRRNVFETSGDLCIHIEAFSGNWLRTECIKTQSVICQIKGNTTTATTEPQCGSIGVLTFVLSIAGVILVCVAFSAVFGIIVTRKASATQIPERNVCQPANDYSALQQQPIYEDLNV